jgi:hypothetical protein
MRTEADPPNPRCLRVFSVRENERNECWVIIGQRRDMEAFKGRQLGFAGNLLAYTRVSLRQLKKNLEP